MEDKCICVKLDYPNPKYSTGCGKFFTLRKDSYWQQFGEPNNIKKCPHCSREITWKHRKLHNRKVAREYLAKISREIENSILYFKSYLVNKEN